MLQGNSALRNARRDILGLTNLMFHLCPLQIEISCKDEAVNDNEKYEFAVMRLFPIIPTRCTSKMRSNCPGILTGMKRVDI